MISLSSYKGGSRCHAERLDFEGIHLPFFEEGNLHQARGDLTEQKWVAWNRGSTLGIHDASSSLSTGGMGVRDRSDSIAWSHHCVIVKHRSCLTTLFASRLAPPPNTHFQTKLAARPLPLHPRPAELKTCAHVRFCACVRACVRVRAYVCM